MKNGLNIVKLICFFISAFVSVNHSFACLQDGGVMGPMIGHIDDESATILFRPDDVEKILYITVRNADGTIVAREEVEAESENDFVAKFHVTGLEPAARYTYEISTPIIMAKRIIASDPERYFFETRSLARAGQSVTAAFVSCVDQNPNAIWPEMEGLEIDMLCLMGDTPYIDSSDLDTARAKHRSFLQLADVAALVGHTPTVGVWDDHDFGLNNGNGLNMATGKENTRRAFVEYRGNSQFGDGSEGVYHSVDAGMMEIFLLDPRYFSQTGPSPVDPAQTTCFGEEQWRWLLEGLENSEAPFKVLAMGAIWQDKKNSETDDMFTYWYEREALFEFIAEKQIPGVVLLGGDIHVARHLIHPHRVGYDLHDFIISPGHTRVIESLNVYHPSLEWSLVEGRQFLTLTADGNGEEARLIAQYRQPDGKLNREVVIHLSELTAEHGEGIHRDLRAYWNFDNEFTNRSRLNSRIDAQPENGVTIAEDSGVAGGSAAFERAKSQFLNIPRNVLHDNSTASTVSMWIKPETLPQHGSEERYFLLESTAAGKPDNAGAYSLSIGLRSSDQPDTINLQLYTHTLKPADRAEAAPTALSQGPFSNSLKRTVFDDWTHIALTTDTQRLRLFVGGQLVSDHPLDVPGPASESGGLIIGGHRAGTGRNFDGHIDEVAIWSRVLTDDEILSLADGSHPLRESGR